MNKRLELRGFHLKLNIGLSVLSFTFVLLFVYVVANGVIRKAQSAQKVMDDLASGDIQDLVVNTQGGDEIDHVLKSAAQLNQTIRSLVRNMQATSEAHELGDIDAEIATKELSGSYADLANGINAMLAGHIEMNRKALNVVKAFGDGDLSQPLEQFPGKKAYVNEAIEQVRANIKRLVSETQQLVGEAVSGNLSFRADDGKHKGEFRNIVKGVNDTLDAVIEPLKTAADYVDRLSKGNIPEEINAEFQGDFDLIKKNLNACGKAVKQLIVDIQGVTQASERGDLTHRANPDLHQGDFGKVVNGVNMTLDALLKPLNVAAECVNKIAQGSVPAPISEHYQGEFNNIKQNLNTCIQSLNMLVEDSNMLAQAAREGLITVRADTEKHQGDFRKIVEGVNETLDMIVNPIKTVKEAIEAIHSASDEISRGNNDLSSRTEQQASNLQETSSSMDEIASTVRQNAENANQGNQLALKASEVAVKGGEAVEDVVQIMSAINSSAHKIEDIISVIDGIAFQTNILALNAAVEAARAGEQGRGFAVVAGEVRSLAQRTSAAAKEIKELIIDSVNKTMEGSNLVENAGSTITEVVVAVKRVTYVIGEITAASNEQISGIDQVNQAILDMDETTQQNAALVEQAAAAAESLVEQADQLALAVSHFKLQTESGAQINPKGEVLRTGTNG